MAGWGGLSRLGSPMAPSGDAQVTARAYRRGDEADIQRLFERAFGQSRSLEQWRWKFELGLGEVAIRVLERDGRVAGHLAWQRFDTFVGGQRSSSIATGVDLMIDPDIQGRGFGAELVRKPAIANVGHTVSFPTDQTVALASRPGQENRIHLIGRLPQWVRWRSPVALAGDHTGLHRLARMLAGAGLSALRLGGSLAGRVAVEELDDFDAEFDQLSQRLAGIAPCIRVRDAAYLGWRWKQQPDVSWQTIAARSPAGELLGYAVYGRGPAPHDGAEARGRVVDLLAADPKATRCLLAAAAERLEASGCRIVSFECADPRPWARRAPYLAGFAPRGFGPNVTCRRIRANAASSLPEKLGNWYLTLGDTDHV